MYIPKAFLVEDKQELFRFVRRNSFGILFSRVDGRPFATHLPFLLDESQGGQGVLYAHMAKTNPHWQTLDEEVLVVFHGPHAYVSPAWYEEPGTVPTWNYIAVHAYGRLRLVEEQAELKKILVKTVDTYESGMPNPWRFDPDAPFAEAMYGGVVGFAVEVTKWEGKWKLSQNHSIARRQRVIRRLRETGDPMGVEIAAHMEERLR